MAKLRMRQAIVSALADEMEADERVVLFGEDVAEAGGPFKTSEGLLERFGPLRVRDTPISEMGFLGAAVGAAATGLRPVVEIMFIEFLGVALDQLSTEAAKFHYLSGGRVRVPLVMRASVGGGLGFGSQHSQTLETWLTATPGLKVVSCSGPANAYGLLRSAIRDDNPVAFLEPRALYGDRGEVDTGDGALIPLGRAHAVRTGEDVTVVSLGRMVGVAQQAAMTDAYSAEVLDLQTLVPWDREAVLSSVARTRRLVVVEESPYTGGWGGDIVAHVAAELHGELAAPPLRITCPDVPVPFAPALEARHAPTASSVQDQITQLLETGRRPRPWWEEITG
jgi:acetoin:2,6-dichlorophenolindophenol oxidoreductase subunit beta